MSQEATGVVIGHVDGYELGTKERARHSLSHPKKQDVMTFPKTQYGGPSAIAYRHSRS